MIVSDFSQFYSGLVRFMSKRLKDRDHAVDVVHEAYARCMASANEEVLSSPLKLKQFLYTTAVNVSIDEYRKTRTWRFDADYDFESAEERRNLYHLQPPTQSLYKMQRVELMLKALSELPKVTQQAFLLRKLEGLSHDEIADQLDISLHMVAKHIINAMKHCRIRVVELEYSKADKGVFYSHGRA